MFIKSYYILITVMTGRKLVGIVFEMEVCRAYQLHMYT